ncbi:MAG: 4,5-DOPA dioxygenase extradiol, partial [Candidatus Paracaedibacteraceae bacterium]|nr:4,5-DOPA dioxygenase extradiol [Candidatus Paracaedibacteraceae bacterium]
RLGTLLPKPKAVLCISAHWEAPGVRVTSSRQPETIHDFYGFPEELFAVEYPAPGGPDLAQRVSALLQGHEVVLDAGRGLDHGAWGVLRPMYPAADVPVIQLSMDTRQPLQFHYEIAKKLAPLRNEGVLILGSGNIVHNLRAFRFDDATAPGWALEFNEAVKRKLSYGDHLALIDYRGLSAHAALAVPTIEHFLPLIYVLGVQDETDKVEFMDDVVQSAISMTSVLIHEGRAP